jgi:hypothetical protein
MTFASSSTFGKTGLLASSKHWAALTQESGIHVRRFSRRLAARGIGLGLAAAKKIQTSAAGSADLRGVVAHESRQRA